MLAPSTAFGREVTGRAAAATRSGLVGDAIGLAARDGVLVAAKPAFAGALVADITCRSATQMVTVRPGVLPAPLPASAARRSGADADDRHTRTGAGAGGPAGRRRGDARPLTGRHRRGDRGHARGVRGAQPPRRRAGRRARRHPEGDRPGWAPRSRQVGITGRSIAPRLYVAVGLSGKFNHMVGVRAAGTILAVNTDRNAPVFEHCDVGIVGDWHQVVPQLREALRRAVARRGAATIS